MPTHTPWLDYLSLAASMALVGSYVGLSKLLVTLFPIFLLAWLRFGIAAVAMAGWVRRPVGEPPLDARRRRLLFWESFLGNCTALAAGVIMAALPGAVALLSRLFLRERIAPRVLAGIACAVGGIALVSFSKAAATAPGAATQPLAWLGNLLLLAAVFCEASYVVIGKQLTGHVSPKRISALVNLWGLALVTPLGLWQALSFDFSSVTAPTWGLLLFYALAASMVTVWLWMTGLRHVPAAQAGVFTVMLPLSAAAVGVGFLGESVSPPQAAAFALALTGVVLATWPQRRRSAAAVRP